MSKIKASPLVGKTSPSNTLINVVFPAPLGPNRPKIIPLSMFKETLSKALIPLLLKGNQTLPESRAVAYINHETKSILVNSQGLPPLEEDKTYQMWADVDGVMVNMGLLPADTELIPLKYIDRAESLNITIEPAGGNDHPTVENLISNVLL